MRPGSTLISKSILVRIISFRLSFLTYLPTLVTLLLYVHGYPSGAPSQQCGNMFPAGHGVSAQPEYTSPYILRLDRQTFSCPGDRIKVTLSGKSPSVVFRGFLCQPRPSSEIYRTTGTFFTTQQDPVRKQNKCDQMASLTHVDNTSKSAIAFSWKPETIESVYIICTIVEKLHTFWVKISSPQITFTPGSCSPNDTNPASTDDRNDASTSDWKPDDIRVTDSNRTPTRITGPSPTQGTTPRTIPDQTRDWDDKVDDRNDPHPKGSSKTISGSLTYTFIVILILCIAS